MVTVARRPNGETRTAPYRTPPAAASATQPGHVSP